MGPWDIFTDREKEKEKKTGGMWDVLTPPPTGPVSEMLRLQELRERSDRAEQYALDYFQRQPGTIGEIELASQVAPEDREAVLAAVQAIAKSQQPQKESGFLARLGTSANRGVVRMLLPMAKYLMTNKPVPELTPEQERFRQALFNVREGADPVIRPDTPWAGRVVQQAAEMAYPMAASVAAGGAFGGGAKALGAGKGLTTAASVLGTSGSFFPQIQDETYRQMIGEGLDPDTSKVASYLSGALEAAVESVELNPFFKERGGLLKGTIRQTARRVAAEWLKKYGKELSEEAIQGAVRETAMESMRALDQTAEAKGGAAIPLEAWNSVAEAAAPLALMMAPSAGVMSADAMDESRRFQQAWGLLDKSRPASAVPREVQDVGPEPSPAPEHEDVRTADVPPVAREGEARPGPVEAAPGLAPPPAGADAEPARGDRDRLIEQIRAVAPDGMSVEGLQQLPDDRLRSLLSILEADAARRARKPVGATQPPAGPATPDITSGATDDPVRHDAFPGSAENDYIQQRGINSAETRAQIIARARAIGISDVTKGGADHIIAEYQGRVPFSDEPPADILSADAEPSPEVAGTRGIGETDDAQAGSRAETVRKRPAGPQVEADSGRSELGDVLPPPAGVGVSEGGRGVPGRAPGVATEAGYDAARYRDEVGDAAEELHRRVRSRMRKMGFQAADAEDLAQAIALKAIEQIDAGKYDPSRGTVAEWLTSKVWINRAVIDHWRKHSRLPEQLGDEAESLADKPQIWPAEELDPLAAETPEQPSVPPATQPTGGKNAWKTGPLERMQRLQQRFGLSAAEAAIINTALANLPEGFTIKAEALQKQALKIAAAQPHVDWSRLSNLKLLKEIVASEGGQISPAEEMTEPVSGESQQQPAEPTPAAGVDAGGGGRGAGAVDKQPSATPVASPSAKEPWQMTASEFDDQYRKIEEAAKYGLNRVDTKMRGIHPMLASLAIESPADDRTIAGRDKLRRMVLHKAEQDGMALTPEAKRELEDLRMAERGRDEGWGLTRGEFSARVYDTLDIDRLKQDAKLARGKQSKKIAKRQLEYALEEHAKSPANHKSIVEQALRDGKPVPQEVLAEYPDIQTEATSDVQYPNGYIGVFGNEHIYFLPGLPHGRWRRGQVNKKQTDIGIAEAARKTGVHASVLQAVADREQARFEQAAGIPRHQELPSAKEPWQMTREEFEDFSELNGNPLRTKEHDDADFYEDAVKSALKQQHANAGRRGENFETFESMARQLSLPDGTTYWDVIQKGRSQPVLTHEDAVRQALAAGKPVPEEVAAEYREPPKKKLVPQTGVEPDRSLFKPGEQMGLPGLELQQPPPVSGSGKAKTPKGKATKAKPSDEAVRIADKLVEWKRGDRLADPPNFRSSWVGYSDDLQRQVVRELVERGELPIGFERRKTVSASQIIEELQRRLASAKYKQASTDSASVKPKIAQMAAGAGRQNPTRQTLGTAPRLAGDEQGVAAADIQKTWDRIWGAIRHGGFSERAAGIYKWLTGKNTPPSPDVVRTAEEHYANLAVLAHEIAHRIDEQTRAVRQMPKNVKTQVKGLDYAGQGRAFEGWAEFFRMYVTEPDVDVNGVMLPNPAGVAPLVYDWFTKTFLPAHREIADKTQQTRDMAQQYANQSVYQRLGTMIADRAPRDVGFAERWKERMHRLASRFKTAWLDKFHTLEWIQSAAKERGHKGIGVYDLTMAYFMTAGSHAAKALEEGVCSLQTGEPIGKQGLWALSRHLENDREYPEAIRFALARHVLFMLDKDPEYHTPVDIADAQEWIRSAEASGKRSRYEQFSKDLAQFNNDLIQMLVVAGAIPAAEAKKMLDYYGDNYFPMHRVQDANSGIWRGTGAKFVNLGPAVHGRSPKGSGRQIIDPLDATVMRAMRFYARAIQVRQAHALAATLDPKLGGVGGLGGLMDRVDPKKKVHKGTIGEILDTLVEEGILEKGDAKAMKIAAAILNPDTFYPPSESAMKWFLERHGLDPDTATEDDIDQAAFEEPDATATIALWRQDFTPNARKRTVVIYDRDGKPLMYEMDPDLYEVAAGLQGIEFGPFLTILHTAARWFKSGAVALSTGFGLANLFRDFQEYQGKARHVKGAASLGKPLQLGGIYVAQKARQLVGLPYDSALIKLYEEVGGKIYSPISHQVGEQRKMRKHKMAKSTMSRLGLSMTHGKETAEAILGGVQELIAISDAPPRLAEMEAAIRQAGYEARGDKWYDLANSQFVDSLPEEVRIRATLAAAEATINFKRIGALGQKVEAYLPFYNATMQAAYRQYRQIKNLRRLGDKSDADAEARRYLVYLAARGAMAAALWFLRRDDDDYREMETWLREQYYTWGWDGKTYIRVPKSRDVAVLDNIIENLLDKYYHADDARDTGDMIARDMFQRFPVGGGLTRGLVETFVADYDYHKDRQLTPEYLKDLPKEQQYTPYTTGASRWLGSATGRYLGISPIQLEHLASSASGGMYRRLADFYDAAGEGRLGPEHIPAFRGVLLNRHQAYSADRFYSKMRELDIQVKRAKADGAPDVAAERELAEFREYAVIMTAIREAETLLDGGRRSFQFQPYIVGLAREALGFEPLPHNPSPLGQGDLPAELRPIVYKAVQTHANRALLSERMPQKVHSGDADFEETLANWKLDRDASMEFLRKHRDSPIVAEVTKKIKASERFRDIRDQRGEYAPPEAEGKTTAEFKLLLKRWKLRLDNAREL